MHSTTHRWSRPARAIVGVLAAIAGIALFAVSLSPQQVSIVTGLGLAIAGVSLLFRVGEDRAQTLLGRIAGGALIALGIVLAAWPDAGAPWLAFLVAAAIMVHAAVSLIAALRGDKDLRAARVLIALAGIGFGVLTLSWPVLTLALFRLAVGAWLVFLGVRLVIDHAPAVKHGGRFATWARTIGAALALVLSVGAAYGSAQLLGGTPLPAPTSFYSAPESLPSGHGQLIRTERLTTGVPTGTQAWRMLYTTTDAHGKPAVSSGTILAPADPDGSELPLLTVSHGTTGVVDGCAPSLSATPFADGAGSAMAEMVADHGWVAVISDYVGMGTEGTAAYLVGDSEAKNVLDASLAAQQFEELSISSDTVVWGHSQGGQGSLWTGQIATDYAPSLQVLGVAAFAPAADLYGLADADKKTAPGKTVSAYIASTWNEVFPELSLESQLTPGSRGPVDRIGQLCFNGSDALSAILLGSQVPNQVFPDDVLAGPFGDLLKQQTPTGPWPAPVLVAQGLDDPLVLPRLQQGWVDDRCQAGMAIDYRTFDGLNHVSLVAADSPLTTQIVEWTLDRWEGAPAPDSCTSQEYPQQAG